MGEMYAAAERAYGQLTQEITLPLKYQDIKQEAERVSQMLSALMEKVRERWNSAKANDLESDLKDREDLIKEMKNTWKRVVTCLGDLIDHREGTFTSEIPEPKVDSDQVAAGLSQAFCVAAEHPEINKVDVQVLATGVVLQRSLSLAGKGKKPTYSRLLSPEERQAFHDLGVLLEILQDRKGSKWKSIRDAISMQSLPPGFMEELSPPTARAGVLGDLVTTAAVRGENSNVFNVNVEGKGIAWQEYSGAVVAREKLRLRHVGSQTI